MWVAVMMCLSAHKYEAAEKWIVTRSPGARNDPLIFKARRYSKRIVDGAVILRSSGSVTVMIPKAITSPMPMIR